MINFDYSNHTEIVFGKDTENRVGELVKKHGGKKVLLHYGGSSAKKSGLYDRVVASLSEAGISFVELGGVQPNPRLSLVHKAIELCRKENVDFILAVGGGSVIDSSKAISMGIGYDGDVWDYFEGREAEAITPIGAVLTIPAAGSESSTDAVITNDLKNNFKWPSCSSDRLRPVFSVLNPEITFTLPDYQTAAGATDIIAHAFERYFTNDPSQDLSDRLLESVVECVVKYTPVALENKNHYASRAQLMWAGTLAHNNLFGMGRTGDWASHMMEHELSALYDVPHGAGLAVIMPAWMEYVMEHDLKRFGQMGNRVFGAEFDVFHQDRPARRGIERFRFFLKKIGMPSTLEELGISGDRLEEMSDRCTANGQYTLGSFVELTRDDVLNIYKSCLK